MIQPPIHFRMLDINGAKGVFITYGRGTTNLWGITSTFQEGHFGSIPIFIDSTCSRTAPLATPPNLPIFLLLCIWLPGCIFVSRNLESIEWYTIHVQLYESHVVKCIILQIHAVWELQKLMNSVMLLIHTLNDYLGPVTQLTDIDQSQEAFLGLPWVWIRTFGPRELGPWVWPGTHQSPSFKL